MKTALVKELKDTKEKCGRKVKAKQEIKAKEKRVVSKWRRIQLTVK